VERATVYFSIEEIDRARGYHRPAYVAWGVGAALVLAALGVLAFSPAGGWLAAPLDDLPRWAFGLLYPALVVAVMATLRFPIVLWRGFLHERRWGFSTQTFGGWLWDWTKGVVVTAALTGATLHGLVEVVAALPRSWPVVAAPAAALVVAVLSFLGPILFEPLFNRFRPLEDEALAGDLLALAARAGVRVREVLVADATRRTRKENAYVSGLLGTRRVVLFDTLLGERGPGEVRAVVAHELGHRRARDVARGTALAALGAAATVVVLWAFLRSEEVISAVGATGPSDPRIAPFVLLVAAGFQLATAPLASAVSRRWEAAADRAALELTGDAEGFARVHRRLATANLSDLAPPRLIYLLLFSHPLPQERIRAALASGR
jgi:Zn-dependent protease with chaperone function